ncbi:MAG: immunoglobulin domain-containing protein, partial [Limisphaerales bacterium]
MHQLPTPPTALKAKIDVKDANVTAGSSVGFTFTATNDAVPVVPVNYQWYKNDQTMTNVTGTAFTFLATAADNGAKVYCQASLPTWDNPNSLPALYSATGTVTVASGTMYTNGLKREVFMGANRTSLEAGGVGAPSSIQIFPSFTMPVNDAINNYAQRVSGWFIPPITTNYNFFVCSDDDSDLFVSTDETPAHKQLVAQETGYSNAGEWTSTTGSSNPAQKRSDQFSPDGLS